MRLAAHIIPITMYTHIHSLILGDSNSTSRSVEYDDSGQREFEHVASQSDMAQGVSTFTVNVPVVVAILTSACQVSPLAFHSANRLGVEDIKPRLAHWFQLNISPRGGMD